METIMISTILVNICIGCFACVGLTTAISMIQSIINDHKREKREQESGHSMQLLNAAVFLVS